MTERVKALLRWPQKKVFAWLVKETGSLDRVRLYGFENPEELYEELVRRGLPLCGSGISSLLEELKGESEQTEAQILNGRS